MAATQSQQDAIAHDGHLLIVAGPGSGKTTTSVAKAQRILSDPTRSLVMVTFTKEGAEEMRRRLDAAQEKIGQRPFPADRLLVGTFHSIAIKHLFKHRRKIKVLSPGEQGVLFNESMGQYRDDKDLAQTIRMDFESFMYSIDQKAVPVSIEAETVIHRYLERLEHSQSTDLYHIMRDCALAADSGEIPPMPFTDMLVDEGQDTDELQKVWIFAHARAGIRTTIVGDDDQSIYEWRHALGFSGMRDFLTTFNARRIELGDNFRCKEEILSHAVVLIEHNQKRLGKHLVARRGEGGHILAYRTPLTYTELADLIKKFPETHAETAILARNNRALNEMEFALSTKEITYTRIGKSIWDNPWVSSYLSFLQSLLEGTPVGIFGCLSLIGLDDEVRTELLRAMKGSADAILNGEDVDLASATATDKKNLREFGRACNYWRKQLRAGNVTEVVLDVGGWMAGKQRSRWIGETIENAAGILAKLNGTLASRLFFVNQNKKPKERAAITLMTMHASKGMEFETVHIIEANEDDKGQLDQEPERRLMYVAITRAKNRCMAWYSNKPHPTLAEAHLPVMHSIDKVEEAFAGD